MVKHKKHQQHALLLGLGVGIVVVLFLFLGTPKNDIGEAASQLLVHEEIGITNEQGEVIEEKLLMLRSKDYQEIKKSIGLEKEFCIYFQDEKGNLIAIDEDINALGSPEIKINNQPCVW